MLSILKQTLEHQVTNIHTYTDLQIPLGRDLLNQTIFHIQISMKGLVVIHNLPPFDEKTVALRGRQNKGL